MTDARRKEPEGFEEFWNSNPTFHSVPMPDGSPEPMGRSYSREGWLAATERAARIAEEHTDLPNASESYNLSVVAGTAARIAEKIRGGK